MGEIADMMLDGFLDEETGELIDGDAPGFPRRMSDPNCHYAGQVPPDVRASRRAKNKRKRARRKAARLRAATVVRV